MLVTHAHFDHLHRPSLRAIARASRIKSGRAPLLIVPDNVSDLVFDLGFDQVVELGWWQEMQLQGTRITATPAKHWGARVIRDMHRGYGGYVLSSGGHSIYHSGDTAYFGGFAEIGERLHPEVALLPIGAYHPDSFRAVHTSPEDALRGFVDLGAQTMIPMHFGTFKLSQEPVDEPVKRLLSQQPAASAFRIACMCWKRALRSSSEAILYHASNSRTSLTLVPVDPVTMVSPSASKNG